MSVPEAWELVTFGDLRPGDVVRSTVPRGRPLAGMVLGQGVVHEIRDLKDHQRAVDVAGDVVARSDYPAIFRRIR